MTTRYALLTLFALVLAPLTAHAGEVPLFSRQRASLGFGPQLTSVRGERPRVEVGVFGAYSLTTKCSIVAASTVPLAREQSGARVYAGVRFVLWKGREESN